MKDLLLIFSSPPYSNAAGQEGLDMIISAATMELQVSVLFIDDGVFQLLESKSENRGQRVYTKGFAALEDFGVESVYIEESSIKSRGIDVESLIAVPEIVESNGIARLIAKHKQVLTF